MADGAPMVMAGLWAKWKDPKSGAAVQSCTIITCEPNSTTAERHDRMPVILAETDLVAIAWRGDGQRERIADVTQALCGRRAQKSGGSARWLATSTTRARSWRYRSSWPLSLIHCLRARLSMRTMYISPTSYRQGDEYPEWFDARRAFGCPSAQKPSLDEFRGPDWLVAARNTSARAFPEILTRPKRF